MLFFQPPHLYILIIDLKFFVDIWQEMEFVCWINLPLEILHTIFHRDWTKLQHHHFLIVPNTSFVCFDFLDKAIFTIMKRYLIIVLTCIYLIPNNNVILYSSSCQSFFVLYICFYTKYIIILYPLSETCLYPLSDTCHTIFSHIQWTIF